MKKRKPYSRPRIRVIELETHEVMGTACKTMQGPKAMGSPHCSIVQGGMCMADGS